MLKPAEDTSTLIVASRSKYRAELLSRLAVSFIGIAPDVDESPLPTETAQQLTQRLAFTKAHTLSAKHPGRWVLGSDQVACVGDVILGKPGTHARAIEQLSFLSGKSVEFHTAVTLIRDAQELNANDLTTVRFRELNLAEIERYLKLEPAYDCAGSFKCEGLGIALFEEIRSTDPTGLIGLPLIAVRRLLLQAGIAVP